MSQPTRDPVHRVRYTFEPEGENLIVDTWLEPGGALPEHYHPVQEEHWWVVDGQVSFSLDGDKRVIGPEDGTMEVKPHMRHSLNSVLDRDAHLRCRVMPGLGLQDFLQDSSRAAAEGLFMRGGIPRSLRGARWAAGFLDRHRAETVMTFPPPLMQSAMIRLFGGARG